MSAAGAWFARALASVGGPQTAAVVLVVGLVAGGVGGYTISTNQRSSSASPSGVPVYPCPNQGPALLTLAGGQQLLVTGRLADDSWLRIHLPEPGRSEGWVRSGPLNVSGSVDSLPVVGCGAVAGAPSPAVAPLASLTAIVNATPSPAIAGLPSPSPAPTASASTGPSPSPTPGAPTLTGLTASTRTISYDQGSYCPSAVKSVTISVKATSAAGVAGVSLFWREPGAASYAQTAMTMNAGSAASGTWSATLNTSANGITSAGTLSYYAVVTDAGGATGRAPSSGTGTVAVAVCANSGPKITQASSSSGSSLSWDPLGVGSCQTATNITAVVADPDGVKAVTLFFRRPGDSAWSSKPMDNQTIAGKWYGNLDTLGDKIAIPNPPTGTLNWYIKAVDGKGLASQTKAFAITVSRCDSPATFDGVFPTSATYSCASATIQLGTYASDRDQPEGGLKVVFYWQLVNPRTKAGPISGSMSADSSAGIKYFGTTSPFDGKTFYYATLTAYVVTIDKYGGKSQSPVSTATLSCK